MDSMVNMQPLCPVCGFQLDRPAWIKDEPSYDICPSCGTEFGYNDYFPDDLKKREEIHKYWRNKWIDEGMKWQDEGITSPPPNWDPNKQLERLLEQEK